MRCVRTCAALVGVQLRPVERKRRRWTWEKKIYWAAATSLPFPRAEPQHWTLSPDE